MELIKQFYTGLYVYITVLVVKSLLQWRTEGVRGEIRPGRHSEGGGKKGEKEKQKKWKKRFKKTNMGEACNFSKTIKWSILAAAPLCTYNLTFRRSYPFWRRRVVRLIIRAFA